MDIQDFAKLCDARQTLCKFCEADECESCIVNRLIDDAYNELPDKERAEVDGEAYGDDGSYA